MKPFESLMRLGRKIHDALRPVCARCGRRSFVLADHRSDLCKLKAHGLYLPEFEGYAHVCSACWNAVAGVSCGLCERTFIVLRDRRQSLLGNFEQHGVRMAAAASARWICADCETRHWQIGCERCGKPFPKVEAPTQPVNRDPEVLRWLSPYHPDYRRGWVTICPVCRGAIASVCRDVERRLRDWAGGTRHEHLANHRTLHLLGRVEYTGTDCGEPAAVEHYLKLYAAQLGGNAYGRFFWQAHQERHEHRYIAGYGPRGNPYYQSRFTTERWYTGSAEAAFVVPASGHCR